MYELDSTINLRSLPNGVKDELNLLTGEYIQRVGEIVLDETVSWSMDTTENAAQPNTNIFYTGVYSDFKPLGTVDRAGSLVCDKINVVPDLYFVDKVGIMSNTDPRIYVRVLKTDASDVATFTTYIQNNPLTLQYELAEPITSHVRLVSNNQEREVGVKLPQGQVNTYNPSTGITTIRVGKVVLDGSEDWKNANNYTNTYRFKLVIPDAQPRTGIVTDGMYIRLHDQAHGEYEYIINFDDAFYLNLYKTELTELDIPGVRQYLASNPITVWYELKYPQIQPDIVLPNGVHDEYNPETGVYTKKVGFIEFDGSEDENWGVSGRNGEITSGNYCYYYNKYSNTISQLPKVNTLPLCDKLQSGLDNIVADNPMYVAIGNTEQEFRINIPSGESSATACKQWLVANPLKVWYELATPITYQLTPYFGLPQPYAYEDGYLIHDSAYSKTTLPPEFKYKLVANRTGQVMQNNRKLQEHTTRLSNLEALIIEATIQSLFDRELQTFELELMDIQLIDLGE